MSLASSSLDIRSMSKEEIAGPSHNLFSIDEVPTCTDQDVLLINQPFFTFVSNSPLADKVMDMIMNPQTLTHAITKMLTFSRLYRDAEEEVEGVHEEEDVEEEEEPFNLLSGKVNQDLDIAGLFVDQVDMKKLKDEQAENEAQEQLYEEAENEEGIESDAYSSTPELSRNDFSINPLSEEYACREDLSNISKDCVEPIHVMQWSGDHWKYGVLDVFGSVFVENGTTSDAAMVCN
ncbi:hypothetical protein SELMODRAFT_415906 [Selaginella moellendorffii]|uniref:Uncharacterized protein n=1 Tax=Selaginella moellendorffii TaxID=88036 RepID=D8RYK1_SELML|nr:hypothetical protein SELMODRAFT_415906 [Selaginella moellendorffii]